MDLSPNVGEDDLHALVDGQLASGRHREVMAYLAVHPDAADRTSAFLRQRVELAALREGLNDTGEPEANIAALEQALTRAVRHRWRMRRMLGGGGLIAVLLAGATGLWVVGGRDFVTRHVVASAPPGERPAARWRHAVATEPVAADTGDAAVIWLQAHLAGRSIKQPDLEASGLRFVGSTALKSARAPAIRLLYVDEEGRPFDLFVGVRRSGVELAASLVPDDHVSLSWQQDPLVFTLIAPQGSPHLGEIMRSANALMDPAPVAADAAAAGGRKADPGGAAQPAGPGPAPASEVAPKPL